MKEYDVLVVGSGAAGSFAVKELTERGLNVLLLEAGRNITEADFVRPKPRGPKRISFSERFRAALHGQHIQGRVALFRHEFKHLFVNDREHPYTVAKDNFYLWIRGRQLGGRLHTYGKVVLRMSDYDFKAATWDCRADVWPISYADLAAYYDRVEGFLRVYGSEEHLRNLPDGPYFKESKLNKFEEDFKSKIEAHWSDRSVIPWRHVAPNLRRVPLPILAAQNTGRLTIRTDAIVKQITIDRTSGKATGAIFIDRVTKKNEQVSARVVVLCASTIESVRLMLNSACSKHPNGLGNSSGLLGHYFMDQCPSLVFGTVPGSSGWELDDTTEPDPFYPPSGGMYIPRFHNLDNVTNPRFVRGFAFQGTIGRSRVPENKPAVFAIMGFGEMPAYYDNCITLNPNRKDAWGIPVAHINCSLKQNEHELLREQLRSIKEMVKYCGYSIALAGSTLGVDEQENVLPGESWLTRYVFRKLFKKSMAMGAAVHECGGARMGIDPSRSVLNPYNQCWDVKNLFVTDGSCFVSTGTVGPSLTIMALSVRASEYIAQECKSGSL